MPTEKFNWSVPIRGVIALAVFLTILIVFSAPASAGTYSVYSCKGPAGEPLDAEGWVQRSVGLSLGSFVFSGSCATTGLSVATSPTTNYSNNNSGSLVFEPPANTTIDDFEITRQLKVGFLPTGTGTYSAVVRERQGLSTTTTGCVSRSTDCSYGIPVPEAVSPNLLPADSIAVEVSCNAATCVQSNGNVDVRATLVAARVDLLDTTAPEIEAVSGSLLAGPSGTGSRSLIVSTSDVGGGVRRVSISVDGATPEVHETGGSCAVPFSDPVPCPANLTSAFVVDTAQLAGGAHSVVVTVEDAGGETATSASIPFTVPDAGAGPPIGSDGQPLTNGVPAVERPLLNLSQSRIESKSGGVVTVAGTLLAPDGTPISGASVSSTVIDLGTADGIESALPAVQTGADGSFSIAIAASGAKRVRFSFRPNPNAAETAFASVIVRQALKLSVKRSKARVKPRGTIVISGVLTGAGTATDGAPVEINALVGGRWRAVGVVETNSKGKYSWRYRFVSVRRATTFKFRALVRRSAAWPWSTEIGNTVSVRVAR